jgi:hypothetical protein
MYYRFSGEGAPGRASRGPAPAVLLPENPASTPSPHNPVPSHRHAVMHPVRRTGHAELVQTADDSRWALFLQPPGHRFGRGEQSCRARRPAPLLQDRGKHNGGTSLDNSSSLVPGSQNDRHPKGSCRVNGPACYAPRSRCLVSCTGEPAPGGTKAFLCPGRPVSIGCQVGPFPPFTEPSPAVQTIRASGPVPHERRCATTEHSWPVRAVTCTCADPAAPVMDVNCRRTWLWPGISLNWSWRGYLPVHATNWQSWWPSWTGNSGAGPCPILSRIGNHGGEGSGGTGESTTRPATSEGATARRRVEDVGARLVGQAPADAPGVRQQPAPDSCRRLCLEGAQQGVVGGVDGVAGGAVGLERGRPRRGVVGDGSVPA